MRSFDKIKNIQKTNLLTEERYLESKGTISEDSYRVHEPMDSEPTPPPEISSDTKTIGIHRDDIDKRIQLGDIEIIERWKENSMPELRHMETEFLYVKYTDIFGHSEYVQLRVATNRR